MGDGLHLDPQTVARRCTLDAPDYSGLTPVDWVVLDFTDGLRSFEQILDIVPTTRENLIEAYVHLRLLGFLTWKTVQSGGESGASSQYGVHVAHTPVSTADAPAPQPDDEGTPFGVGNPAGAVSQSAPKFDFGDEICACYIPARLFDAFRGFSPKLFDSKLDLPAEMQAFVEFIYDNLSILSPYEILGIENATADKGIIRQAYMQRTKQFHPDRYFRKNLGPFAPRIAAIFKAVSNAFSTLQAS